MVSLSTGIYHILSKLADTLIMNFSKLNELNRTVEGFSFSNTCGHRLLECWLVKVLQREQGMERGSWYDTDNYKFPV